MKKEGGCECYQSMGHIFLYISANFLLSFKGPWPFKSQKTLFSGLTTQYAPRLNLGPSAAKKTLACGGLHLVINIYFMSCVCLANYGTSEAVYPCVVVEEIHESF